MIAQFIVLQESSEIFQLTHCEVPVLNCKFLLKKKSGSSGSLGKIPCVRGSLMSSIASSFPQGGEIVVSGSSGEVGSDEIYRWRINMAGEWLKKALVTALLSVFCLIILNNWNASQNWDKTASKIRICHEHTGNKAKNICKRQWIPTLPGSQAVHCACLRSEGECDIVHGGTSGHRSSASARQNM